MVSDLVLDLLDIYFDAVEQEEVGVDEGISNCDDWAKEEEENESHELVGS